MSIEYQCANTLLKNKFGKGLMNYKQLSKINIDKFINPDGSYYTSDELWNIAVNLYKDEIIKEAERIANEENISKQLVIKEWRRQFQYRVYEASIAEAICIWNIKNSENYALEGVTDEEDLNNKIDIRFKHKETQISFCIQVKKYNKNFDVVKRTNELMIQISNYGAPALYFEIEFSEKDRNRRKLYFVDSNGVSHVINFQGTYGRGKEFHDEFVKLLDFIHENQLKKNFEFYQNNF